MSKGQSLKRPWPKMWSFVFESQVSSARVQIYLAGLFLTANFVLSDSATGQPAERWLEVRAADYVVLNAKPLEPSPGTLHESGPYFPSLYELENALDVAPYCAMCTISDVRYECVSRVQGGAFSLAIVEFEVNEPFWGLDAERIVIETLVSRPECMTYSVPKHEGFVIGDRFLVVGPRVKPENYIKYFGLLLVNGEHLVGENGQAWVLDEVFALLQKRQESISAKAEPRGFQLKRR